MDKPLENDPAAQAGVGVRPRGMSAPPRLENPVSGIYQQRIYIELTRRQDLYSEGRCGFSGHRRNHRLSQLGSRPFPDYSNWESPPKLQTKGPDSLWKGETTNEARIRILEAHVLDLIEENRTVQRHLRAQEQTTNTSCTSPVPRSSTSNSDEAVKRSIMAYVNNRLDHVQQSFCARMDRRDYYVNAQIGQLAFYVRNIVQGLDNLSQYVANLVRDVQRSVTDTA
ncbi:hypothetical protein N7509_001337 [Penicillium cosmopolitanum]|uniref:Uncharacterized protein n=1 Tax=Penicillium cosmopolitanum TaxID=1131564 RepID=A0A9X0BF09_9EURO|nr:uncharacterized protein N7509_001337 [Penicillium cosmopolitanum]KAJ5414710.1 hypothetical protein N7509_001337 [Penicillium cosmopolitanum]